MDPLTIGLVALRFARQHWQPIAIAALVVASIAAYNHQISLAEARGAATERATRQAELDIAKRRADAAERVTTETHRQLEIALANTRERIRTVTKTNTEEVTKYVTITADARCTVPVGLVQHHDAAAAGRAVDPAPAVSLVDQPSGIALSRVESVVAENYGTAHEWRAELLDCRARYISAYEMIERFKRGR